MTIFAFLSFSVKRGCKCRGVPGQSVFDDLVPEVKSFSEEVLEVRTSRLVQSSIQRSHAVYSSYGLPHTAGHQTLLDCSTASTHNMSVIAPLFTTCSSVKKIYIIPPPTCLPLCFFHIFNTETSFKHQNVQLNWNTVGSITTSIISNTFHVFHKENHCYLFSTQQIYSFIHSHRNPIQTFKMFHTFKVLFNFYVPLKLLKILNFVWSLVKMLFSHFDTRVY